MALPTSPVDPAPPVAGFRDPAPFLAEVGGQRLTFLPGGADRLEALVAMIRGATVSLKMAFYIFAEDRVSVTVRDELVTAARRGVRVLLIIDRFGSSASDRFLAPIKAAGGEHRCFSSRWSQRYLIRNHQKIVIADDTVAMFGGFNIADDYFTPPQEQGWTDLAITVEGAAVGGLVEWFAKLDAWTCSGHADFAAIKQTVAQWDWKAGPVRWLVGGPTRGLSTWAKCVSEDLREGEAADIMMAYFTPPSTLMREIGEIAAKGRTRLVMAGKSDNTATIGASRWLYRKLLRSGARIWEFAPTKLHSKLIVLDDTVYVGSANLDMRSLYINLELMLEVRDAALADLLRAYVSEHIAASEEITRERYAEMATPWNRLRWWLGWVLVSVVDYTVSRRLNLGF